ncbi:porin family protein [Lewinella sp. W8]|uniref:porin family protein n=1 Tax=Lewinella sp. W8 TaxID=2528208 RepID=UPI001068CEC8|nr:porin family protein [Lewinella sp. W8]MTB51631.1 outer membrane beta-barrel protein [Lewinella sp. W8]
MRKSLCFFALLCLTTAGLSAQSFGLRAGVNFTNVNVSAEGISISFDSETNLMAGVFLDLPVGQSGKFMLSPELSYVGRGYGISIDFFGTNTDQSVTVNYVDLGFLAKYMLLDNGSVGLYAAAGPVLGYALGGEVDTDGMVEDIEFSEEDGFNRTSLQLALAGGLTFGQKFFAEVRYMRGLNSLNDESADDEGTIRWTSFGVNAGVRLPLGGN